MQREITETAAKEKVLFTWSGGKDSAMALYALKQDPAYDVAALLTTVTRDYDRISMHGVRTALLDRHAASLGLPLEKVFISKKSSSEEYESGMMSALESYKESGVVSVAFGDIFLEDLRKYREDNLSRSDMKAIFPVWKRDSSELARDFIALGFKAKIACVDSHVLDKRFAGREFDTKFLSELPAHVDPCGENGEFHSFVYDGPIFGKRIDCLAGEIVLRNGRFYYCDLLPDSSGRTV